MTVSLATWLLGRELTRQRHHAGLSTRDAALRLGVSSATLNRSENGLRPFTDHEVGAALTTYTADPNAKRRATRLLLRQAQDPAGARWMAAHEDVVHVLETSSTAITEFSATTMPPSVRTATYASALRAPATSASPRLDDPSGPLRLIILDATVLHRPVGGHQAMAVQLRHLALVATSAGASVRVIPPHRPYPPIEAFTAYHLPHRPPAVRTGTPEVLAEDHHITYRIDTLLAAADDETTSTRLILRIADDHDRHH
ncbi:Scr1 family TA system antitoxin-like transcriptional regulator [Actinokineospora pegani]|uniref:Scr1 family TA system antitoxin-like transcriptional regulator n=1 Tax=Actinokineospora pegani TaxID=2654637 RepID=UPI0018D3EB28|nr:Scr1 family TA system antitoxin-like transcriptional regulator [Actinokineospora pegani]